MNRLELEALLCDLDVPQIECDGATRIAFSRLHQLGVSSRAFIGSISVGGQSFYPHLWLVVEGGIYVDYKARMWLGEHSNVPHGVFAPDDFPDASYKGEELELKPLSEGMQKILLAPFPDMEWPGF